MNEQINNKFYRKGESSDKTRLSDFKILSLFYAFEHEGMIRVSYLNNSFQWFCAKNANSFYPIDSEKLESEEKESLIYIMNSVEKHIHSCLPLQIKSRDLKFRKIILLMSKRISFLKSKEDSLFLSKIKEKLVHFVDI